MVDVTINSFFIKNEGCVSVADEITKRVSLVELFYDLVFVYMVSRATEMIHHLHHGIVGLRPALPENIQSIIPSSFRTC